MKFERGYLFLFTMPIPFRNGENSRWFALVRLDEEAKANEREPKRIFASGNIS